MFSKIIDATVIFKPPLAHNGIFVIGFYENDTAYNADSFNVTQGKHTFTTNAFQSTIREGTTKIDFFINRIDLNHTAILFATFVLRY